MNSMTITSFYNQRGRYRRAGAFASMVEPEQRMSHLLTFLESLTVQLRNHGGPEGLSFCAWKGADNTDANLVECHALALDYRWDRFKELRDAAERLGFARCWFTGENKAKTINTVVLIIPFTGPASKAHYERIAAVVARELDTYGLVEGALAANHIVNIHATSLTGFERGELLDPAAFIASTKDKHQVRDARKYHEEHRPASLAAAVQLQPPTVTSDDGLFAWPTRA